MVSENVQLKLPQLSRLVFHHILPCVQATKDYVCERTLVISFVSKGFPYNDQIEEEITIITVYCMYSQHVTLSTFSLISLLLTATYFSKARYSLFVLKVPLIPNQSVIQSLSSYKFTGCHQHHNGMPFDTSAFCIQGRRRPRLTSPSALFLVAVAQAIWNSLPADVRLCQSVRNF